MKRLRLALPAALVLSAFGLLGPGAGSAERPQTTSSVKRAHVAVDPLLVRQLATNSTGKVEAVITAWNRRGLDAIARLGVRGARLQVLPMLLTDSLTRAQVARLRRSPHVRSVWANRKHRLLMEDTTWIVRARYTWSRSSQPGGLAGLGLTGRNVHVAVIDTGADGGHEDMDNLVEFCESQQAVSSDHTTVQCAPFNPASGNAGPPPGCLPSDPARKCATDDNGHGSHVLGTIAGTGDASGGRDKRHSTMGLSPNAKVHMYSANIGPSLAAHEILSSYDDMINKKVKGLSTVVAVNNSWGGGSGSSYNPDSPQSVAFKRAYDAGILSVFAAGNSGAEHNTLSGQCINPFVVCVAASTKPDSVVMFSSRGRPSEPADTNRDGEVGGAGDIAPDNHDRRLAQAFDDDDPSTPGIGLYRPTLSAPGVNINSINANEDGTSPLCREILAPAFARTPEAADARDCYVQFNGTSMATPHVTGSIPLIVQAYRQGHGGRTPTPGIITDILERSANVQKLPGYEAEEQGAGRLDVYTAAKFARAYPNGLPRPNFGTPSPPYQANLHPGAPATITTFNGCTGSGSWTARELPLPEDVPEFPPISTQRYGEHFIDVPEKTERLRVTVRWPIEHQGANLYVRLWRPGVDPSAELPLGGQTRVFPDQEGIGLTDTNAILSRMRWLDIRAPEETGVLPSGKWVVRVYHRIGGASTTCPSQIEGYKYEVKVEIPQSQLAPTVQITSPAASSTHSSRWVTIRGTAGYPTPWDGVTNYEVPGSGNPATGPEGPDTRTVLHFHGNKGIHNSGEPDEASCTGDGAADLIACDGPYLLPSGNLSPSTAASWFVADPLFNGAADRNIHDPNWIWRLSSPTTLSGPMTVEWWASCGACDRDLGLDADWRIRLWADGVKVFEQRLTATPAAPNTAEKLEATVNLPTVVANNKFVLHVDPVFIDSQANTRIYYDSTASCPTAAPGSGACDSIVRMPMGAANGGGGPATPANVRVTDVHSGLRVAWDSSGASMYEIHRSTNPAFAPGPGTRIATTSGTACDSPSVPSWPSASDDGLCYPDGGVALLTTYYYRVVAVDSSGAKSKASQLAYGTRTEFDRQVKLKVDRLYGPQYWEYATLGSAAGTQWTFLWDTVELVTGQHPFSARSFTQGIGSAKATQTVTLDENGDRPPPPGDDDPDDDGDDDGDGNEDDDGEDKDD
jgi:serine protease AprX